MSAVAEMPTWDLKPIFPGIESEEFDAAFAKIGQEIGLMGALFDRNIDGGSDQVPFSSGLAERFEETTHALNQLQEQIRLIGAYLGCMVAANTRDTLAQAKQSELQILLVQMGKLNTRYTAWIGRMPIDELIEQSDVATAHAYALRKAKIASEHLMSPAEENLASELRPTGSTAWGKLHGNMTSQLEVEVDLPDGKKIMPMSAVRNLAYDADAKVRMIAYKAELDAWKRVEVPLAAAMNSVKGEVGTLTRLRNWSSPLEPSLFDSNIDQATLDAMLEAVRNSFPSFRKYMRAKAGYLAASAPTGLAWSDQFAPVGQETKAWSYEEGKQFVREQFYSFSDKMGEFADRAFREEWVDAPPRAGKVDGAFCMGIRNDESRILMNYKSSFSSVRTLAHELGHGYHNLCLNGRTMMQRQTPMTVAETASIFCETVVNRAGMKIAHSNEQLSLLEGSLQGFNQVVVDVIGRMFFERSVFEDRTRRELSPQELCELMLEAQNESYGDGLDPNLRHPYMWAVKPHYYGGRSFYNYPYTFGLLFSLGLYAQFESDSKGFRNAYDDLLSSTGLYDAPTLANRFGINVREEAFWAASLGVIQEDIDRFVSLIS